VYCDDQTGTDFRKGKGRGVSFGRRHLAVARLTTCYIQIGGLQLVHNTPPCLTNCVALDTTESQIHFTQTIDTECIQHYDHMRDDDAICAWDYTRDLDTANNTVQNRINLSATQ
jgi:hypothetical protein